MQNLKEFFLLLWALIRFSFKWVCVQPLKLVPLFANLKALIVAKYYRWKFPQIMQMRKLVGAEATRLYKELEDIRSEAMTAYQDHGFGTMSKSQLKKKKANVHNAEKYFFEKNRLRLVNGLLYQLDQPIDGKKS